MSMLPLTRDQARFLGASQPRAGSEAFDGARESGARSRLPRPQLGQKTQIPSYTRVALLEKQQFLHNNVGLVKHMSDRTVLGAVGNGIIAKSVTLDSEWNKRADAFYENVSMSPLLFDYEERLTQYEMQAMICRSLIGPGESFTNMVDGDDGMPRMQTIPCQFIRDGGGKRDTLDGLVLDPKSSAVRQYCYSREWGKATYLKAANVLHVYRPDRTMQYRGIPWISHGINALIDMMDLTAFEKQSEKFRAALAGYVRNSSGTVGKSGITGKILEEAASTDDPEGRRMALEKIFGGEIPFLGKDEELIPMAGTRNSAIFSGFLDWIARDVAIGYGLKKEYVISIIEAGGANTRFILDEAQIFFDAVQTMIVDKWCRHVRIKVLGRAMAKGLIPQCKDPEWPLKAIWKGPAKGTVDAGKTAQSDIALMDKGLITHDDYHARAGRDGEHKWKERVDEVISQKKYVKERAKAEGVEVTYDEVFNAGGKAGKPGESPSKDPSIKDKGKPQ